MLPEKIVDKFEHEIDKKLDTQSKHKIFDGFKNNKTINEVLDKTTIMTLHDLINKHIISYVNGVVRSGKESQLFWAVDKNGKDIALKIYLVSTSSFKKRASYILGDPRFSKIRKGTRNLVYLWAKKEFRNLIQCVERDIPSTKPIYVTKNILVMEFVGKNGVPEKTLVEAEVSQKDYESTISLIKRLYKEAKLVHGDLSEFNIFKTENGLMLFDLASGVDIHHPNAHEFLKRDINNISKFFVKRGLTVANPADIFELVIK
jgi:RIO kinase 1